MTRTITVAGQTFELIPASEVPPPDRPRTDWRKLFGSIPPGKAFVLTKGVEIKWLETVRAALSRLQAREEFLNVKLCESYGKLYIWEEDQ